MFAIHLCLLTIVASSAGYSSVVPAHLAPRFAKPRVLRRPTFQSREYRSAQTRLLLGNLNLCHQNFHRQMERSHVQKIRSDKHTRGDGFSGVVMRTFYKLPHFALASLLSVAAWITMGVAHAEVASIYGGPDGRCGSLTASGEHVNCSAMTAAHRTLPLGSRVTVCHRGCVVVRINDRGPFVPGRHIDLTPAAARAIGLDQIGQVTLEH
jgi:rare lipoprotein A